MPEYRVKGPDGKYHGFNAPAGLPQEAVDMLARPFFETVPKLEAAPEPKPETGFIPSIKRGVGQLSILGGDIIPAMAARAVGADEYAERQLKEAAASAEELQKKYPTEVASYKDIDSVSKAYKYVVESVGEALPSMIPSLITGGAAGIIGRGATQAAMTAAQQAVKRELMSDAAKMAVTRGIMGGEARAETLNAIKEIALKEGLDAARKTALKYQAAGALTGSAAQNIPDVYQNIYEETGKQDLGTALAFGSFNAVLDAITPINLLRKAKVSGIPSQEIIGAWYKRAGKGALEGFATEGGTEALQEMSSAAAEKFVDNNKDFFTEKNFERFVNAGLKGGIGGGTITAGTNVLFGRREAAPEKKPEAPTQLELTPEEKTIADAAQVTDTAPPPPPAATTTPFQIERTSAAPAPVSPEVISLLQDEVTAMEQAQAGRAVRLADAVSKYGKVPQHMIPLQKAFERDQAILEEKKKQLAERTKGAPNVGRPDTGTGGTSVPSTVQPSDALAPAAGTEDTVGGGVGAAGQDVGAPVKREGKQPSTVTTPAFAAPKLDLNIPSAPVAPSLEERLRAMTDAQLKDFFDDFFLNDEEYFAAKAELARRQASKSETTPTDVSRETPATTTVQESVPPTPPVPVEEQTAPEATEVVAEEAPIEGRPTKEQIKTGMAFDEATIANLYNEDRIYGVDETNDQGNRVPLPEWNKLTRDQKDLYLGYIKNNTGEEHDKARNALINYRQQLRAASHADLQPDIDILNEVSKEMFASDEAHNEFLKARKSKMARIYRQISDIKANPAAAHYIYNRKATLDKYNQIVGEAAPNGFLPEWSELPADERQLFSDSLKGKKNPTGKEIGAAFRALIEKRLADEQVRRDAMEQERQQEIERREAEAKQAEEEKRKKEKTQPVTRGNPKNSPYVPDHVIKQVISGNLKGVLDYLRTAMKNKLQRAIAQRIFEVVKLNTKIKMVDSLPNDELAQYDPQKDTILVTPRGMKDSVLLHEVVHAATVKVIDAYLNKYKKGLKHGLTEDQLEAAEHLENLMEYAQAEMGNVYPEAFKNLFEFVSYSLSDQYFQDSLANLPTDQFQYTILPEYGSLWSDFVYGIVKLLKWTKAVFTRKDEVKKQVALLEVLGAIEPILATPTDVGLKTPLPAKTLTAPALPEESMSQTVADAVQSVMPKERGPKRLAKNIFTKPGLQWAVTAFQNERYPLKVAEDRAKRFGLLRRFGEKMNNLYEQISLSTGKAEFLFNKNIRPYVDAVHKAVDEYATLIGKDANQALARLHLILQAAHEPERRHVKFLLNVPLDDMAQFTIAEFPESDGSLKARSAEGWRKWALEQVAKPEKANTKKLRQLLETLATDKQFHDQRLSADPKNAVKFDENGPDYNVIAERTPAELKAFLDTFVPGTTFKDGKAVFPATERGKAVQKIVDSLEKVKDATTKLNKEANYYSQPVENVIELYDFKNYVPFKGKPQFETINEEFNIESTRIGGELQDAQDSFEGRKSESENPLLQILADGATSALRAARKDMMKSLENAVNDKIIKGEVLKEPVRFDERYILGKTKKDMVGRNKIFSYQPDGSIKIIEIRDLTQLEALRRTYRTTHALIEYANMTTSFFGQMHTRYNPSFATMNFVRDALTNAFTLGAELGPSAATRLLGTISKDIAGGGMKRSFNFARLYANGQIDQIEELAKTDSYYRDLLDYVEAGGKVSYLQGIAAKGALDELIKDIGRSGVMKKKEQIDKFVDIYNDIFELSSRVASYRTLRDEYYARNKAANMSDADAAADAKVRAIAEAKNLANFEQVGRYGKGMGAMFMFFRPAATGAVRAIEAVAPMFRYLPTKFGGFDEQLFRDTAKAEGRTPEQIDKAVNEIKQEAKTAAQMAAMLLGMGMTVFMMASLMGGDDDAGRNKVMTDDPARWTRYVRIHIPGTDTILQIPWGFGLGAFAAAGAQLAFMISGNQSVGQTYSNIFDIGMDSFLPLPISRIPFNEKPIQKIFDTLLPSAARPFFEYVMNVDGLGREIYNNRQTRYGNAYTGGDNVPEVYKLVARKMFDATNGAVDVTPNTMYFFTSNYADGVAKMATMSGDALMLASGYKGFDESTAKSLPFVSSFIGSKSNYDARQFSKYEDQAKELSKRMDSLKNQPDKYAEYIRENPGDYAMVTFYNKQVNGALRQLRAQANAVRANPELTAGDRKAQVKELVDMQNMVKRNLIEVFKQIEESY